MMIKLTEKMKYIKDPNLKVEKIVGGLDWPTSMGFLGQDDILVLEKIQERYVEL
jgi:DNA gyrase/topoisomerase IV subunit A